MKKFRSTKNLKPIDPQTKQQSHLKMKVKALEQQVALLQKSNLNIFIPITQHVVVQGTDYQAIINKLRQQVLGLEQENQNCRTSIKRLQREKEQLRAKYYLEMEELMERNRDLEEQIAKMEHQLEETGQKLRQKIQQNIELDKCIIQKNVELKFVHEDLFEERRKKDFIEKQLNELKHRVSEVIYSSRIHRSLEVKCICLEKTEYDAMKDKILELEDKIRAMLQASKREKITLGTRKSDIGEQIVRLKKNIDLQLGISGESKHSQQFLKIYKGTNQMFNQLIKKCQV